jgi:hypothetical protein
MYTAQIQGQGFCMARQFRLKREAYAQCEDWARSYDNDGVNHAYGFPAIGYLAFETEPGLYGENIIGAVRIDCYRRSA